ncbi:MAG: MucBP domain-containing protein, partial [Eubacterium sp.]|nr:MucBP domain-containing protein [Eubacterium sp.]
MPGSVLKVGVIAYVLSDNCDDKGYSKWVSTGYDELYDVPVGEAVEGKHKLTVNHVNQNNRMIAYQEVSYLAEGEKYNVPSLNINGYTAKKEAITGTMGSEDITLNLEYEGEATTISIAYKSWGDGSEQDIADAYTANVKVGDSYSVDSPDVEGFQLSDGDYYKTVKGIVPVGGVSQTVYYTKTKYWLSVRHLDENGNELYPQADQYQFAPGEEYYYDDSDGFYSAPIRSFEGYTLVSGDYTEKDVEDEEGNVTKVKVIEGTMPEKNKDVTLNYVHNQTYVNCKFSFVGLDDTVTAPEGIPADFTDHVDSWSSYMYEPPVIDGWQIVNDGSYSNYYDARKNLLTVPGDSWNMLHSSEENPFVVNFVYKQKVDRTISYLTDDSDNPTEVAPSKTVTLLAGADKDVENPVIAGYICSKGATTTIEATGGSDVTAYYTPFTEESGDKIVQGIPGEVKFDTSSWNPERPEDAYKATLEFAWTSNIDTDEESVWKSDSFSEDALIYIGGEYAGKMDGNKYSFYTDDSYFKKNHDNFKVTIYQPRSKNAYYGYESDVYVKSEWTLHLPLNPVEAEEDEDSICKVVPATATVTPANESPRTAGNGTFGLTFDAGTIFDEINVAWTLDASDVKALGATAITRDHH